MGRISQAAKASEAEGEHADRQTPSQKAGPGYMANRPPGSADIDKATEWLVHSAGAIGAAKARAVKAEKMLGHIEALLSKASDAKSAEAKKADARADDRYLEAINEMAESAGELAKLYSLREAAVMKIEAWRTECATMRSYRG